MGRGMTLMGLGALLVTVAAAHGEEPRALQLGARVRASVTEGSSNAGSAHSTLLTGRLLAVSETDLTIETSPGRPAVVVPRHQVAGLEQSLRPSRRKQGALIGLAVGAAAGLVLVAADHNDSSCPRPEEDFLGLCRGLQEAFSGPEYYAAGALLLGAAGAGIGALVAPGEKWETVTGDRMRVAVGPASGGGVRFVALLRF
jgi:hypothetical protein